MELKKILEILDLPTEIGDIEKPEDMETSFKEAVSKRYLTKEQALNDKDIIGKISGRVLGASTTKLKQVGGFTESEVKDKKLEEVVDMLIQKKDGEINILKETATKDADGKLKEANEEIEKLKKTANKYKTDNETLSQTLATNENNFKAEIKTHKIKTLYNSEYSKVKFKDDITALEKEGYNTLINKKYKWDLDESGENLIVRDEKGEPVSNPKKVGTYYTPYEVLELEASNNKVAKMNNANNNGSTTKTVIKTPIVDNPNQTGRKIAPSAQNHSQILKDTAA